MNWWREGGGGINDFQEEINTFVGKKYQTNLKTCLLKSNFQFFSPRDGQKLFFPYHGTGGGGILKI